MVVVPNQDMQTEQGGCVNNMRERGYLQFSVRG